MCLSWKALPQFMVCLLVAFSWPLRADVCVEIEDLLIDGIEAVDSAEDVRVAIEYLHSRDCLGGSNDQWMAGTAVEDLEAAFDPTLFSSLKELRLFAAYESIDVVKREAERKSKLALSGRELKFLAEVYEILAEKADEVSHLLKNDDVREGERLHDNLSPEYWSISLYDLKVPALSPHEAVIHRALHRYCPGVYCRDLVYDLFSILSFLRFIERTLDLVVYQIERQEGVQVHP